MKKNRKPIAVLISDVHYSLPTLEVADKAMNMAIEHANRLNVRLIIAGDLHDTKANLRGECVKKLMDTLNKCVIMPHILVGNHDKINEKSTDNSLDFLRSLAYITDQPVSLMDFEEYLLVPYLSDTKFFDTLGEWARKISSNLVIMHQGVVGSETGDYLRDRTAIHKEQLSGLRCISGHYHRRQTFDLPEGGKFDYIGNPYTLSFSEANDPEKGYQILYDDYSLEFVPTNLRKHVVLEYDINDPIPKYKGSKEDILWVKITGPTDQLEMVKRSDVTERLDMEYIKLDKIPISNVTNVDTTNLVEQDAMIDAIIDSLPDSEERKLRLKEMWKNENS